MSICVEILPHDYHNKQSNLSKIEIPVIKFSVLEEFNLFLDKYLRNILEMYNMQK